MYATVATINHDVFTQAENTTQDSNVLFEGLGSCVSQKGSRSEMVDSGGGVNEASESGGWSSDLCGWIPGPPLSRRERRRQAPHNMGEMASGGRIDRWVCPNDRQLALRAK
ncbi:LIM domain binding [Branchiostoma belcheri]|nr:LIM domain binding [Branchiostoma belcheri]